MLVQPPDHFGVVVALFEEVVIGPFIVLRLPVGHWFAVWVDTVVGVV